MGLFGHGQQQNTSGHSSSILLMFLSADQGGDVSSVLVLFIGLSSTGVPLGQQEAGSTDRRC